MDQNKKEARDISSAIFLIFIGMIFLLNTTGIVGWEIWLYMFRFWPVLCGFVNARLTDLLSLEVDRLLSVFVGLGE